MSDKKPLQIYPDKHLREFLDSEKDRTGLSLNKYIIKMIEARQKRAEKSKQIKQAQGLMTTTANLNLNGAFMRPISAPCQARYGDNYDEN